MTLKADSWEEDIKIQQLITDLEKMYAACAIIAFMVGVLFGLFLSFVLGIPTLVDILSMYEISIVYLGE